MSRLPTPGADSGNWGDILNDYLSQSIASDGTLKAGVVGSTQLQSNSITSDKLANGVITTSKLSSDFTASTNGIRSLLIFYAAPNIINAQYDNNYAAGVLSRYDDIVLGSGLQDPNNTYYASTVSIIQKVAALSPGTVFWGYINTGVTSGNTPLSTLQTQIDQWIAIGAKGIFMDTFGYDYQTPRGRQNSLLSYVHGKGYGSIINAWNADDALASTVDANYNPSGTPTAANSNDVLILESWITNSDAYTSPYYATISDVKTRGDKAIAYRSSLGIRVFGSNVILHTGNTESTLQGYRAIAEGMARIWRLDGSGMAASQYSASGADVGVAQARFSQYHVMPFRPTAPYNINNAWTQIQASDLGITINYATGNYTWTQL